MAKSKKLSEDYAIKHEIEESLKTSNYLDKVAEVLEKGGSIGEGIVPDYSGNSGGLTKSKGGMTVGHSTANESSSLIPITTDMLFNAATTALNTEQMAWAINNDPMASADSYKTKTKTAATEAPDVEYDGPKISKAQWNAIQKYPALIELLGTSKGDSIVKEIAAKVNVMMIEKLAENAKSVSKYADKCIVDRKNIKQYFVGENNEWACQVTANGPFRGNEAIYYDPEKEDAYILRLSDNAWVDVTDEFNVVHDFASTEKVKDSPENIPDIVE
jgi:hypothetical protein